MDKALLDVIVCPVTKSKLRLDGEFLHSDVGNLKYPIKDGIPVLIAEQAILPSNVKTLDEFKTRYIKK